MLSLDPSYRLLDALSLLQIPGGLSYGSSGTGGTPHAAAEMLRVKTGANFVHVPYTGGRADRRRDRARLRSEFVDRHPRTGQGRPNPSLTACSASIKARLTKLGIASAGNTSTELGQQIHTDLKKCAEVLKAAGIKID